MFFLCLLCVSFSFCQPVVDVFCGLGFYPKNEEFPPDWSGETKFTKCVEVTNVMPPEEGCTPVFTHGMYADLNTSFNWGGTQWKDGTCVANSCPTINENFITVSKDVIGNSNLWKICNKLGCLTDVKGRKCFKMKLVTFFIILAASVGGLILLSIIACTICCCCCRKKKTEPVAPQKVGVIDTAQVPLIQKEVEAPVESGAYVVIKLGTQERQTKKVKNDPQLTWAESIEFVGLHAEDDDVSFQLKNDTDLIGTGELRLVEYVNKKMGVSVPLKDSAGVEAGVLEIDVEVVVDETLAVPEIKATFLVDKGTVGKPEADTIQAIEEAPEAAPVDFS